MEEQTAFDAATSAVLNEVDKQITAAATLEEKIRLLTIRQLLERNATRYQSEDGFSQFAKNTELIMALLKVQRVEH